jgi:dTDP-4-amino-4,6-dideoxygalactose transaminase
MIYFNNPNVNDLDIKNVIKICKSKNLARNIVSDKLSRFLKNKLNINFLTLTQSGSSALEVAMHLLNLKPSDEVIVPSYTFSATANAVVLANGRPVFADIREDDLCIDLNQAEKLITKNTKAICLVHYGGNSCDIEKALYLKKKYKIKIIEDAAHALFSKFKNQYCGTIGDVGIYSFHDTKNFTSAQGGAIAINNKNLIKRGVNILNKGNSKKLTKKNYYYWVDIGSEYEMSGFSAALLLNQISRYTKSQYLRSSIFDRYEKQLSQIRNEHIFKTLKKNKYSKHSYHLFALIFKKNSFKKKFIKFMLKRNIQVMGHYYPLHMSPMGKKYKNKYCTVTENLYDKIVRLPIYPGLKNIELEKIIKAVKKFVDTNK